VDSAATADWYTPANIDNGLEAVSLNGAPFGVSALNRGAFSIYAQYGAASGSTSTNSGPKSTSGSYNNYGNVQYNGSSSWTVNGDFNANDGSALAVGDTATVNVQGNFNGGNSALGLGTGTALGVAGTFTNGGATTFNANSTLTVGGAMTNNGNIISAATLAADSFVNNGTVAQTGGSITLTGNFNNGPIPGGPGAELSLTQSTLTATELDFYKNAGLSALNSSVSADTVNNAGTMTLGQGSTLNANTVNNTGTFTMDVPTGRATLQVSTARATLNNNAATASLQLDGTVNGNVNVNSGELSGDGTVNGDVSMGGNFNMADPVTFKINGNYAQSNGGTLSIELDGTNPGTPDFDRLLVSEQASLAGTLDIILGSSFIPAVGDSFEILTYGSVSGTFTELDLPSLPPGDQWSESYGSDGLSLTVVPEPSGTALVIVLIGLLPLRRRRNRFVPAMTPRNSSVMT
jgi:hypothetical protein